MNKPIKAAAIQMKAELGNIESNLEKAEKLIDKAAQAGSSLIMVPEFFTSAMAFHPSLLRAALPLQGKAHDLLTRMARKHHAYVGGSFLASRQTDLYNTFVLAMPDGAAAYHDKDQPTMWENCYYKGGDDDGVLSTPLGPVGAVLCWEFIRNQTVERLLGRVDLIVGGSCWWSIPRDWPPQGFWKWHHRKNKKIMSSTPATLARMLGVAVVHAAHAGEFNAHMPLMPGVPYSSHYLGETQIVDRSGVIVARMTREDGEGMITADITPGRVTPSLGFSTSFWIPNLPRLFRLVWAYQNYYGRRYYNKAKQKGMLLVP